MSNPASAAPSFNHESFHNFFENWLVEQNQYLHELISASEKPNNSNNDSLQLLINRVIDHYEYYYSVKSKWAKQNILAMFSPSWTSSLEDAFLWIGGWRPTTTFHLLYSKSGLQLESQLHEIIRGLCTNDLGDLSASQLNQIDKLQRCIIQEERDITEKYARLQETVAASSMVELTHEISQIMRNDGPSSVGSEMEERVESTIADKQEGLVGILQEADDLRLKTLKGVLDILSPAQAVHFSIAAAELQLRFHELGKNRDAKIY